jgi:Holliday junction DNA helicase RuvB
MSEDEDTIQDVIEPFLIQIGFLNRTSRGRMATPLAYERLGLSAPPPSARAMAISAGVSYVGPSDPT